MGEGKDVSGGGKIEDNVELCASILTDNVVPLYMCLGSLLRVTSTSSTICILARVEEFHSPSCLFY